jgi:coenzyme F420 biosynthesis associated uncharacterized protein
VIDWPMAERIAGAVAGGGDAAPLPGDLDAICADAQERVVGYARLTPVGEIAPPESVTRAEWVGANLRSMQSMIDPIAEQLRTATGSAVTSPLRLAGEVVMTAEAGAVTGYLGRRVLGQYELALLEQETPARLLFVAPNIGEAATNMGADRAELLRWIAFHEMTHAVQFTSVPWLREHLGGLLRELLQAMEVQVSPRSLLRLPTTDDVRDVLERVRSGSIVGLIAGPRQRDLLARMQSTMALVEGHAEHVMDAAGEGALPSLTALRATLEQRRASRPPLMRVLERLLGLELKMQQYETGKRFCDAIVARAGVDGLNRAWSDPALLPSAAELADPSAWLSRAVPRAA